MWKSLISLVLALELFASCSSNVADTVVYGYIYTADSLNSVAEAIAVKDGKFIYVGDKEGVSAFIKEGVTEVVDHNGKGMVMPGCYDSHAHFLMAYGMENMGGLMISHLDDDVNSFFEKLKLYYDKAKAEGKSGIFGFGWNYHTFVAQGMPTREQLDAICPDISLFLNDSEGHKGLVNSVCLRNAGIIDAQDNVLKPEIRGGIISMNANGKPDGLLIEQAATYVRLHGLDFDELISPQAAIQAVEQTQKTLLSTGFVGYMDGWSNFFGNSCFYDAAEKLDAEGKLNILLGLSYEIESSCEDVDSEIAKAVEMKKFTKGHVYSDYIKLFMDGVVEGGTGFTIEPYPDGHVGIANWEEDEMADITEKGNAQGLTMHVHTMGDGAVHRTVNAFVKAGTKEARNTLVHVRSIPDEDFKRVADNDIVAVCGIHWHVLADEAWEFMKVLVPANIAYKSYPMKSYFDNGAVMTSHSDYPGNSGSPFDPFSILETAVTGSCIYPVTGTYTKPWWPEELITLDQAFKALTINAAWQMHCEKERGSIEVGKYADYLLADKNVFECPVREIHTTKLLATYFEGKKVYGE